MEDLNSSRSAQESQQKAQYDVHVQRSQESGRGNAENGLVKIMTFFSKPHGRIDPCNQQ